MKGQGGSRKPEGVTQIFWVPSHVHKLQDSSTMQRAHRVLYTANLTNAAA